MNKFYLNLIGFAILLIFSSCTTVSRTNSSVRVKKKSIAFLLKKLDQNKIDYTWFATKAKLKYEGEGKKVLFSAIIRMQKDSLIWVKLKKMNVEGLRMRITPQSIELLNRQESTYTFRPFSSFKEEFGVDLNFSDLQDLLIGNPVLYKERKLLASTENNCYLIKSPESEKEVLKILLRAADFRIKELRGSEDNNRIQIVYDTYEKVNEQTIPLQKDIQVESATASVFLQMTYSKIELNEVQKVSFKVPDTYRKE